MHVMNILPSELGYIDTHTVMRVWILGSQLWAWTNNASGRNDNIKMDVLTYKEG